MYAGAEEETRMRARDEAEIKNIFEVVQPANVRTGDVPGYLSLLTDDIIWCPANGLDRYGLDEVKVGYTEMLAAQSFNPTFTADEIKVMGDFGYALGRATINITPTDGSPPYVAHSRELWLFRKERDDWKMSRMVWNIKPM